MADRALNRASHHLTVGLSRDLRRRRPVKGFVVSGMEKGKASAWASCLSSSFPLVFAELAACLSKALGGRGGFVTSVSLFFQGLT